MRKECRTKFKNHTRMLIFIKANIWQQNFKFVEDNNDFLAKYKWLKLIQEETVILNRPIMTEEIVVWGLPFNRHQDKMGS